MVVFGYPIFADNLMRLVSVQFGVGQCHFNRSLIACTLVFLLVFLKRESVLPFHWRLVIFRAFFNAIAMLLCRSSKISSHFRINQ